MCGPEDITVAIYVNTHAHTDAHAHANTDAAADIHTRSRSSLL